MAVAICVASNSTYTWRMKLWRGGIASFIFCIEHPRRLGSRGKGLNDLQQ